eukprot:COSAG06_NODE_54706_length_293_cov_0.798969_1_plen_74_part_01
MHLLLIKARGDAASYRAAAAGHYANYAMAGTAMAVPLMNDSVEQRAATEAYKKFEAQQQAQRAWLADFDRDSGR